MLISGTSLSSTATVVEPAVLDTVYPVPLLTVAITDPSASSTASFVVATVRVALPLVGILTICDPGLTP